MLSDMSHTQFVVIGDCSLPVPDGVRLIDISLEHGLPAFSDLPDVIASEFVYEKCLYVDEIEKKNPECLKQIKHVWVRLNTSMCAMKSSRIVQRTSLRSSGRVKRVPMRT